MVYTPSAMLKEFKTAFAEALSARIHQLYQIDHQAVVQMPPRRSLGDLASAAPLHLARLLKRKPRDIAGELLEDLELPPYGREIRVEGAGYLNLFLDRSAVAAALLQGELFATTGDMAACPKLIVEHTNINPNKAAHIGHLRNAVLGDILTRALRRQGYPVEVQNYIDDTGVQLADVVVGFLDLRRLDAQQVAAIEDPFDYVCWDLYSEVGRWYEAEPERRHKRRQTLHQLESGTGPRAELGQLVARRVVHCHLATMARLGVGYDLLTHESDILKLDFFRVAFDKLRHSGTIRLEAEGKNEGCWVMPLAESAEFQGLEDPDKVIVRSDDTVTYVGKDIAYQMWKFGLLGLDFHYRYWTDEELWQTTSEANPEAEPPSFGGGSKVINVIDARQSYLQRIVRAGLESLGHNQEAERSVHFAYEMVSLSKSTARLLGYLDDTEEDSKTSLEMSGRKGIGVKADDLLDQLEAKARAAVAERYADLDAAELDLLGQQIATAALRFFMAKATTTRVIAFDLDQALAFEGETGPYLQYSLVRERNIRRKVTAAGLPTEVESDQVAALRAELWSDDLWDLVLSATQVPEVVERATDSLELSLIARHALDLASKFHGNYNRHPILKAEDAELRAVRQATNQIFRNALGELTELLGVPVPEKM